MGEVSNNVIAVFIVTFLIIFSLQMSLYFNVLRAPTGKAASAGRVSFCVKEVFSLIPIGDQTAYVGILYSYDVDIDNPNATAIFHDDTVLFDINNVTGVISFTPQVGDEGDHYVNISVEGICGQITEWEIVKFTVLLENRAPILDPIPSNFTINQSDLFIYDVNATDPDNDPLTFGDDTSMFQINSVTGLIYFTPVQNDVGNNSVMIWVLDPYGLLDWNITNFEIIDINDAPVLHTIGAQTATIYDNYTYDVNVTDVDVKPEWSNISFYDNSTFFDINRTTGLIEFYGNETLNGTYWISISVTDGLLWDEEIISFSVVFINHAPNITSWYPFNYSLEIDEGGSQYFNITKFDIDGTVPSTQWYLNGNAITGETMDEYTYYASYTSSGRHNITVIISDGNLTDSHEWELVVKDVPQSGGGGVAPSGAAPPACIENWRCSEWSSCPVYEIQTRTCTDLNNCGTTFHKPEETRSCVYVPEPGCDDGVVNCHHGSCEVWIDCGGPCPPCPTCSDNIKNCHRMVNGQVLCEEERDCGGPCPPCSEGPLPPLCGNYICEEGELFTCPYDCGLLIAEFLIVIIILSGGSVLLYRISLIMAVIYRKKIRPPPYTDLELLGATTLRKLHVIQLEISKKRVKTIISEFSSLMRGFFAVRFNIRRKFTYIELTEVARRRKVGIVLANRIAEFSMKMTEMEYKHAEPLLSDLSLVIKSAIVIVERLTGVTMYYALEKRSEDEIKKVKIKEKKVELPQKTEPVERAKKYKMSAKDIADVKALEKLISEGENAFANHKLKEAEEIYGKIRMIYDEMPNEVKKGLYEETVRIIKLYNNIMKNVE